MTRNYCIHTILDDDDVSIINMRQKMSEEEDMMSCFYCEAFFNDEQCYKNRYTISENGVKGLGCPRLERMLSDTKLYLVGQMYYDERQWEFQGVFDTECLADEACIDPNYFYIEVTVNKTLPHQTTIMDDVCFPRFETCAK